MVGRRGNEWGINLILRAVLGVLVIHFINVFFTKNGYPVLVGINLYTIPVVACLGLPGVGLLYGLSIFW